MKERRAHVAGQPWTPTQLTVEWGYSRSTVNRLIRQEPGVLKLRRKARTAYQIPEDVEQRIRARLLNPPPRS